jgi:transcriptional regulator with XRE-family HTH domain
MLSKKLKKKRKELGLTQEQAAKRAGMSRQYYLYLEKGYYKNPSLNLLRNIALALKTDMTYFYK